MLLTALCILAACGLQEEKPEGRLAALINSRAAEGEASRADPGYLQYLEKQSLHDGASKLAQIVSGSNYLWRRPYLGPRLEELSAQGSAWLQLNPQTLQTPGQTSALAHLGTITFWRSLSAGGINGLHLAPTAGNGRLWDQDQKRGLDAGEDVVQYGFAKNIGSEQEYTRIIERAKEYHVTLGGDLLPATGGIGPDFMLATRNLRDYPGLFCMIEVPRALWAALPENERLGGDLQLTPLSTQQQHELAAGGLFPETLRQDSLAQLIKSGWAATGEIRGTDGNLRRWVYRWAYDYKRPILNFSDPSNLANKVMSGSVIFQSGMLGNRLLAHSVAPLLGLEPENTPAPNSAEAFSQALALGVSGSLSRQSRAYGGYAMLKDELPLPLLRKAMRDGPDLALDSLLCPAAEQALLSGDAALLNFMADELLNSSLDWQRLVHASSGGSGLSYQLPHLEYLAALSADSPIQRARALGSAKLLHETLLQAEQISGQKLSGLPPVERRLYTTPTGLAAMSLGLRRASEITPPKAEMVRQGQLLLQFCKAMQPGIFMTSGQDLTGALPLELSDDADERRPGDEKLSLLGAYPLLSSAESGLGGSLGLPRAKTLYAAIDTQLYNKDSFFSGLGRLLRLRERLGLARGTVLQRFQPENPGLFALLIELPEQRHSKAYALAVSNFSQSESQETFKLLKIPKLSGDPKSVLPQILEGDLNSLRIEGDSLSFSIPGWSWGLILLQQGESASASEIPNVDSTDSGTSDAGATPPEAPKAAAMGSGMSVGTATDSAVPNAVGTDSAATDSAVHNAAGTVPERTPDIDKAAHSARPVGASTDSAVPNSASTDSAITATEDSDLARLAASGAGSAAAMSEKSLPEQLLPDVPLNTPLERSSGEPAAHFETDRQLPDTTAE